MAFFLIPFLVKGAVVLAKATIASKKVSVVGKALAVSTKTYGASTVIATTTTACIVVGGITWSVDRIDNLQACYKSWQDGDMEGFTNNCASLLGKIHSLATDSIAHSAETVLIEKGQDPIHVAKFGKDFFELLNEGMREAKRP